jgi:hypothetical protein
VVRLQAAGKRLKILLKSEARSLKPKKIGSRETGKEWYVFSGLAESMFSYDTGESGRRRGEQFLISLYSNLTNFVYNKDHKLKPTNSDPR